MRLLWIAILFAGIGCETTRAHVEQGYISSAFTINGFGDYTVEALVTSARVETEFEILDPVRGVIGFGPTFIEPIDHNPPAAGLDLVGNVVLAEWKLQPYLLFGAGLFYSDGVWHEGKDEQETEWGFILQGGLGFRYEVEEGHWLSLDYRQWHESNGSRVFGHGKVNPGFEAGSFWLGYAFDF